MRQVMGTLHKQIINMSQQDVFVIDISGKTYCIPGSLLTLNSDLGNFLRFEVNNEDGHVESKTYPFPDRDRPTVIKQMGIIVFLTEDDLLKEVKKFGSSANLVHTYITEETNLFFGAGKSIVNMSRNDYWITEGNRVFKIPKCDETWRNEYLHGNSLTEQDLGEKDLLVIYTYVGGDTREGRLKITNYTNRWVKRFNKNGLDPIILEDSNLFVFNSKESAEFFVTKHDGKLTKYIESLAAAVTAEQHKSELQEMSSEYKKDKLAIAKTAALMAGSAVVGGLVRFGIDRLFPKKEIITSSITSLGKTTIGSKIAMLGIGLPTLGIGLAITAIVGTLLNFSTKFVDRDNIIGMIGRAVQTVKNKISEFFSGIGNFIRWKLFGWI